MFQLNDDEADALVSQNVIPSRRSLGGSLPYAFTQKGVAMLSSVLRSKRAVQVNIAIMRTFVRLRQMLATNDESARKVAQHDEEIGILFEHIQRLLAEPEQANEPIGFLHPKGDD